MRAALSSLEVLAIVRLKQWAADRCALRSAKTANYQRHGWQQRTNRYADARIVRVIDFERAFATLPHDEQAALTLTYRDGQPLAHIAAVLGCSVRKMNYLLPTARQHLAETLDRLELL